MSYLPAETPLGEPEPWEQPFWDLCRRRTLRFQTCAACDTVRHPPMPFCPACRSPDHDWRAPAGEAELYTYTVVHHASHPVLAQATPYNAAIVIYPQMQAVRLVSNVVNCGPDNLRIGMRLSLVWEEAAGGAVLPRFEPADRP